MNKTQLQSELKKLIAQSPSLDAKKKEVYFAAINILPEDKLESLFRILLGEKMEINKDILAKLETFFPKKFNEAVKEAEKDDQSRENKRSDELLKKLNK